MFFRVNEPYLKIINPFVKSCLKCMAKNRYVNNINYRVTILLKCKLQKYYVVLMHII